MADLARMIEAARVVVIPHVDAQRGNRVVKFIHGDNPRIPVDRPKPADMPARVWTVWIQGAGFLHVRGRAYAATFETFDAAYMAALSAKLVPPLA